MHGALLILKKEFLELIKDKRTVFFTFLMPCLLYPLLFGMMGGLVKRDATKRNAKPSRIFLVDPSHVIAPLLQKDARYFELVAQPQGPVKQAILEQKLEMMVEVPVEAGTQMAKQQTVHLQVLMDNSDDSSRLALTRLQETLEQQNKALVASRLADLHAPKELANPMKLQIASAADKNQAIGKTLGSFLPYMIMLMMFAGAMQHGIYATAGEKERGTLVSLLATRLPRHHIIWGKLLYTFAIGLISALINVVSMGLSLSSIAHQAGGGMEAGLTASQLPFASTTLILTFLLMIPLGLLFANFIVLMGIQAKNTVEAGTAIMPGMVVVIASAVFSMAPGIEKIHFLPYIPLLNVSLAVRKLFINQTNYWEYSVAFLMTIALAGCLTWLSTRLLSRESVLFKV